jgi:V/A-type H+-transporting ATPase subunit D
MDPVSATRSELLLRRSKIQLAVQGRDLLRERRSALVRELDRMSVSVFESMDLLAREAAEARQFLARSVAVDGREPYQSAALAAQRGIEVTLHGRSVVGVPVVTVARADIARARTSRGYSLAATNARTDGVAERFESVLERLLDLAGLEASVRRLVEEIARTTRRMNALTHAVIPRLEAEQRLISQVLDDRELEDLVRLRRVSRRLGRPGTGHDARQ